MQFIWLFPGCISNSNQIAFTGRSKTVKMQLYEQSSDRQELSCFESPSALQPHMTPAWIRATDYSENSPLLIWPQIKANSGQSLGDSWTKQTQMSCLEQCLLLVSMRETFGREFFSNPYAFRPDSKLSDIFEERIGDCTYPVKCHRAMPKTVEWNKRLKKSKI